MSRAREEAEKVYAKVMSIGRLGGYVDKSDILDAIESALIAAEARGMERAIGLTQLEHATILSLPVDVHYWVDDFCRILLNKFRAAAKEVGK